MHVFGPIYHAARANFPLSRGGLCEKAFTFLRIFWKFEHGRPAVVHFLTLFPR